MELEIVERLCRRFPDHPSMKLGPGDDAAILELAGSSPEIVVSTDLLTEGVDFLLARMSPRKIGRKALAVNLSDLAAMAAEPIACVISAALPKKAVFPTEEDLKEGGVSEIFLPKEMKPSGKGVPELMERLCDGFLEAVEDSAGRIENVPENGEITPKKLFPAAIAGGDTNTWDGPLVLSVTVIGRVKGKPLCRHGAKLGDAIFVTGALGGSILRRQFEFQPRIREMLTLNQEFELGAGMDISDGLTLDLMRLCRQSACGAELFLDEIPISEDAKILSCLEPEKSSIWDWIPQKMAVRTPLEHALGDGEDFEILFTAPWEKSEEIAANRFGIPVFRIGRIIEGDQIMGKYAGKTSEPIPIQGFCH
ncbi:MAG: thiamine-monophosphate kinase [Planctomycetaceae bacterium]|nr:thiamine-monophosphate kinase [Planctomycetaceae bacterium]MBQ2820869.1 thiamine-monophosphate kinase [Thermoguttaceae bacterium]